MCEVESGTSAPKVISVAIQFGKKYELLKIDEEDSLSSVTQHLCDLFQLGDGDNYALQLYNKGSNVCKYITEKNRGEVPNGAILNLTFSATKNVDVCIEKLTSATKPVKHAHLVRLAYLSTDPTFTQEFISKQGLTLLISLIQDGLLDDCGLCEALSSLLQLLENGNISFDVLDDDFIAKLVGYVINPVESLGDNLVEVVLSVLYNFVDHSSSKYKFDGETLLTKLVHYLQSQVDGTRQNAITFINSILLRADNDTRKNILEILNSQEIEKVINEHLLFNNFESGLKDGIEHELYVFQTTVLAQLEDKLKQILNLEDTEISAKVNIFSIVAYGDESYSKPKSKLSTVYEISQLPSCSKQPIIHFSNPPLSVLDFECLDYFAMNYPDEFKKLALEILVKPDNYGCTLGEACRDVVRLICKILRVGKQPSEHGRSYFPMFFTHDHPFEELVCHALMLMKKTRKEMQATAEDYQKLLYVMQEQISKTLIKFPASIDLFKSQLEKLPYSEISKMRQDEWLSKEEWELENFQSILELKEELTPEYTELVEQNRLRMLVKGSKFPKYSSRGQRMKGKFWSACLAPNHKTLHYGNLKGTEEIDFDKLNQQIAISSIINIITGKDCPHMKEVRGRKSYQELAFSLVLATGETSTLDFVAPDEGTFDYWTDAINVLLGKPMVSKRAELDLKALLNVDIRLRLLDADNIDMPQERPPIPDDPPDYNFACYRN